MAFEKFITRLEFNKNLIEIFEKSKKINDFSWNLLKINSLTESEEIIYYLEKKSQKARQAESGITEIITFIYNVVYSESYCVPVLYLNGILFYSMIFCISIILLSFFKYI